MKKRGFTLIELLAVIVVLAIIALIATPIVMNVIKNAQKGAVERSAERYLAAVELAIATDRLENGLVADGVYTVDADGNLVLGDKTLTVEVNGDRPTAGSKVAIENGQVVPTGTSMTIGDYTITIDDKGKATAVKILTLSDCTYVSGTKNAIGAKYSCDFGAGARNFYVLEVGSNPVTGSTLKSNEVALILEGNYDTTMQAWCDSSGPHPYNNACAADGLNAKLNEIAGAWTKLNRSQIGLPSAIQLVAADGQNENAYLDSTYLRNSWLYDWDNDVWGHPVYGYWTSTPKVDDSRYAWRVYSAGYLLSNINVGDASFLGVRPVVNLAI